MAGSIYDWDTTAANNATADSDINWQEGQLPSTVNNSAREMMAKIAALRNELTGMKTTGGSGNAYTLTTDYPANSLSDGWTGFIVADRAPTGAATLDRDGLGAKDLRDAVGNDLVADSFSAGDILIVVYDVANGYYRVLNANVNIGDVQGPSSSTDGNFASFNGSDGKTIQDSGKTSTDFISSTAGSVDTANLADLAVTTAKIAASAVTPAKVDSTGSYTFDTVSVTTSLARGGNTVWDDGNVGTQIGGLIEDTSPSDADYIVTSQGKKVAISNIKGNGAPDFTSSWLAVPGTNSYVSAAHGLSATPSRVMSVIKCTSTDAGYAVGDIVCINHTSGNYHMTTWGSYADVGFTLGGYGIIVSEKTTGSLTYIDSTKWNIQLMAWL